PCAARAGVDDVFCCLGTTMEKAGSPEAFRKVDFGYAVALAQHALEAGARQFLAVTAAGAKPSHRFYYFAVKGDLEAALSSLSFPSGVKIFRPSMLLGQRAEARPLERAGQD